MAKIIAIKEIPLEALVLGKGQVRVRDVGKDIDELAASIKKNGLLQPIVVCASEEPGKFEILTGQRRFLAHEALQMKTITSCILDGKIDEAEAKVISISENLVRRDPNSKDYIDACTWLYHKYGSIKAVAEELGLKYATVSTFIKYDRLSPELRKLVDQEGVGLKTALRAQDAATVTGEYNAEEAIKLAKEMSKMSGAQQQRVTKRLQDEPASKVDDVIESAKAGEKINQIVVTLGAVKHHSLKQYAKDTGTTIDDAAGELIEEGLTGKGYSMEEE